MITENSLNYRNTLEINGMPVGQEGTLLLKLSLREVGQEEWLDVAEFPIPVRHQSADVAEQAATAGSR